MEPDDQTPLEIGLTMKSMNVIHKIRKKNHLSEEENNLKLIKVQSSIDTIRVEAPPIMDTTLP